MTAITYSVSLIGPGYVFEIHTSSKTGLWSIVLSFSEKCFDFKFSLALRQNIKKIKQHPHSFIMEDLLGLGLDSSLPVTTIAQQNNTQSSTQAASAATVTPPPPNNQTANSTPTTTAATKQSAPAELPVTTAAPTIPTTPTTSNGEVFVLKQEEPSTAELKEIQAKFGGRWKLVRSDPYAEYLKATGVGVLNRTIAGNATPEQIFSVRGDKIYVSFHSTFHNQNYIYQLEQAVENLVEKSRQSVFASYKNGKLTLLLTSLEPGWNKTQEVERFINELGEHVMIYTCGNVVCRRYFARLPDLITLPPITQ